MRKIFYIIIVMLTVTLVGCQEETINVIDVNEEKNKESEKIKNTEKESSYKDSKEESNKQLKQLANKYKETYEVMIPEKKVFLDFINFEYRNNTKRERNYELQKVYGIYKDGENNDFVSFNFWVTNEDSNYNALLDKESVKKINEKGLLFDEKNKSFALLKDNKTIEIKTGGNYNKIKHEEWVTIFDNLKQPGQEVFDIIDFYKDAPFPDYLPKDAILENYGVYDNFKTANGNENEGVQHNKALKYKFGFEKYIWEISLEIKLASSDPISYTGIIKTDKKEINGVEIKFDTYEDNIVMNFVLGKEYLYSIKSNMEEEELIKIAESIIKQYKKVQ